MSAPKSSRAYGKAWGDTEVSVNRSQGEIDTLIRKYDRFAQIQWTSGNAALQLRFRSNGRNYVFTMRQFEDDPHENRRAVRAVWWFLKGLLGLGVEAGDPLYPERALLPYVEVAPNVTVGDALEDDDMRLRVQTALGDSPLALTDGVDR